MSNIEKIKKIKLYRLIQHIRDQKHYAIKKQYYEIAAQLRYEEKELMEKYTDGKI